MENIKNINFDNVKTEVSELFGKIMAEVSAVTTFAEYDSGLSYTNDEYANYKDRCKACNDFETGILTQGMFQTSQLDEKRYKEVQDFLDKHKNNIAEINFFQLSESLIDAVNPILDVVPLINMYHTAIGITFVDKNNKIIRSAILQLNFGAFDSADDLFERFLAPHFCMNTVIDPATGEAKDPTNLTKEEFVENLFIDYSKSISSFLFSFNEDQDYVTEDLVKSMKCVDVANLASASPVPFGKFVNQNITCESLYKSYHEQKTGVLKDYNGPADGTIFCLNSFGPSIFTKQAGVIIHFATCKNVDKMKTFIDWCFVNYGACSESLANNNLQHYCTMGVDKLYPINELSNKQISKVMEKPNIVSTDNGFIREMKGRTTHCNTVCAVCITLIDLYAKSDSDWKVYTNWESHDLQTTLNYSVNPLIVNIPVISFPEGWENGCTMERLNMDPALRDDKERFYRLWFFARMLMKGLRVQASNVATSEIVGGTTGYGTDTLGLVNYVFSALVSWGGSIVIRTLAGLIGPEADKRLKQGNTILTLLLFIYVIAKFDLFDTFYWATGQSTTNQNGDVDFLVTDSYPTIWKIPLDKENKNILLSYIESVFIKNDGSGNPQTAGEIYTRLENDGTSNNPVDVLNRIIHPFPNNKFYLWFPGIKNDNNCANGYLNNRPAITYLPNIRYQLVSDPKNSNSINMGNMNSFVKPKKNINKYILLIAIVILVLMITWGVNNLTKKN